MADDQPEDFRKYNRSEEEEDQTNRFLLTALVLVLIVIVAYRTLALQPIDDAGNTNELAFITNVVTEGLSIFITVLLIGEFQQRRDRRRQAGENAERERLALEQLKKELLADVKYGSNSDAIRAINRMRVYDDEYGWYSGKNGLLVGQYLTNANLAKCNLELANIQQATLEKADLRGANLKKTNLENANLNQTNLMDADLCESNLRGASFLGANLQGANLRRSSLLGAEFSKRLYWFDRTNRVAVLSAETSLPDSPEWFPMMAGLFPHMFDPNLGLDQMKRYTDKDYDGIDGFWDPCKELSGQWRPWYCDDADEPTP